ncbi:MAG: prolyl oligopeptidase family serine peptidase, partial [Blastocatellia bacterium]
RHMARSIWLPDGKSLLVGANDGTRVSLWLQPLDGPARKLDLAKLSPSSSFWVDVSVGKDGAIAFTATDPTRPAELYYMSASTALPKRLTNLNAEVAGLALGRTEVITWQLEGLTHNGIVTYPPDFSSGKKYPLVLVIHGGPTAASLETFAANAQLMAAKGWVVFQPNYRGSDQIGSVYQRAIINDAGAGPGRDVMAGIEALKQRGFIDTTRIAVSGWSYGGYMTSWLLGNYSGWRVAVAGAAVTDWLDQYNLGDANVRRGAAFGGSPWTDQKRMQAYIDQSPITYASKIRTPTLVMTNTQDFRVTPTQSFKLYHALKDNGVPTRFIAYPIYGHNAADPVRQRDVQRRWIEWIEQYFRDPVSNGQ